MKLKFIGKLFGRWPFKTIGRLISSTRIRVGKSLRLQLLVVFAVCLLVSIFASAILGDLLRKSNYGRYSYIDYSQGRRDIDQAARGLSMDLKHYELNDEGKQEIQNSINNYSQYNIYITDLDGSPIIFAGDKTSSKLDIYSIIQTAMEERFDEGGSERKIFYSIYPINFKESKTYLVVSGIPQGRIEYQNMNNSTGITSLFGIGVFIFLFLMITRGKVLYIEDISKGLLEISKGNLDNRVEVKGKDELSILALNINHMEAELKKSIEEERSAERTKSELITNVSHDLRTPLTSIMGYLGLLKDGKYKNDVEFNDYLNIAYGKSERLKTLIDDLFEYTKLSGAGIKLNKENISFNEFLEQLIEELVPLSEENNISIIREIQHEKITVSVDPDKMFRVFENLIVNAIKYSPSPGEIRVKLYKEENNAVVCIQNKSEDIPAEELERIFDRFYRLEKSRTSTTGGSGLGLAISKSIVELHGGRIWAESRDGVVSFFVRING